MTLKHLKNTVFLPKTDFPMKGDMAKKDHDLLSMWDDIDIYQTIRQQSKGRKKYILHYGPPYANGHIHIGHALTGILKDAFNKSYQMLGYDAPMVIGFDCHGLPIEWKIEEIYLAEGKKRTDIPVAQFMKRCRDFAAEHMQIQKQGFHRLGIIADFKNSYSTMDKKSEATICKKFFEILKKDLIYRGQKPVMWSVVEKTALAEAELEYKNKVSDAIFVKYPVIDSADPTIQGAYIVIWTTTPWTIPVSMAVCYSDKIDYVMVDALGDKLIIAKDLVEQFKKDANIDNVAIVRDISHDDLSRLVCNHPLYSIGFDRKIRLLQGDHVTADAGTGLVHTAPAHGVEDFEVGKKYGLEILCGVDDDGIMSKYTLKFAGNHVFKVNDSVINELKIANNLIAHYKIEHSYPHSWRSKQPLIFRTTDQWFLSIDKIRSALIDQIDQTQWFPSGYINRIKGMVEKRPDWCISRQRVWGVPIALFIHTETNNILMDDKVFNKVLQTIEREGIESWRTHDVSYFIEEFGYCPKQYKQVTDTIEVWFESGCSHHYVLEDRPEQSWPADLYFEGSDQHRGWFQSSLVESYCVNGSAPYKRVATNGFVLDHDGRKMSKSTGNVISPYDVIEKRGADVLRLWCVNSDYTEDMRIGDEILDGQQDVYRKFRNTLRYLLGVLNGYDGTAVTYDDLPELERLMLHHLSTLDSVMKEAISNYDFKPFITALHNFCANDLSAFYFDIRKDSIYCDPIDSSKRNACLYTMNQLFLCICHWLAPILSFTAEEAWQAYTLNTEKSSIHTQLFPTVPFNWYHDGLFEKWCVIRDIRKVINASIERDRANKIIGSSLEAEIVCWTTNDMVKQLIFNDDFTEIAMISGIILDESIKGKTDFADEELAFWCQSQKTNMRKCDRCWRYMADIISNNGEYGAVNLCNRCQQAVLATV